MRYLTFKLSKRIVLYIGFICIFLLFFLNRYKVWKNSDKVEGIYIDWSIADKKTNINLLLDYFNHDSAFVKQILENTTSPYMIVFKYFNQNKYKQLDYMLTLNSGDKVPVLVGKNNQKHITIYTFMVYWLPSLIITLAVCGVWALILHVFYEKNDYITFSLWNTSKNKNKDSSE